jgi:hypothetical protein
VVAAIIDDRAEAYRRRLAEVLAERKRLISLSSWWPDASGAVKLAPASVATLSTPIDAEFRTSKPGQLCLTG